VRLYTQELEKADQRLDQIGLLESESRFGLTLKPSSTMEFDFTDTAARHVPVRFDLLVVEE
jgi:hypothetical protein